MEKKILKEFKFMKKLEKINKTPFRTFIVEAHKLGFIQSFSVNLWLGVKNV